MECAQRGFTLEGNCAEIFAHRKGLHTENKQIYTVITHTAINFGKGGPDYRKFSQMAHYGNLRREGRARKHKHKHTHTHTHARSNKLYKEGPARDSSVQT